MFKKISRKALLLLSTINLIPSSSSFAQTFYEYTFNNTLFAVGGIGNPLTIVNNCGAVNGVFCVDGCAPKNGYCFNANNGFQWTNPFYITTQYTIHMYIRFTACKNSKGAPTNWIRLLDFKNNASDNGIYINCNCAGNTLDRIDFFVGGDNFKGTCAANSISVNTLHLFTFVRDATNTVTIYLDGALLAAPNTHADGAGNFALATNVTPLILIRDAGAGGTCESQGGGIQYFGITSALWTAAQIATFYASICTFLPIELTDFYANINNNAVDLNWTTASEDNNDKFEIERSNDAVNFETIGNVKSKASNGKSTNKLNYDHKDQNPLGNVSYYRLKQVDKDKTSSYSNIISVNFIKANNIKFVVYPNPNSGEFTVDVSGLENNHPIEITLSDPNGRSVYNSTFNLNDESSLKTKIVPDEKLANGVYICTLRIEEIEYTVKVVVN